MKTIHRINAFVTSATLTLYLLIFLGMYAQIILGPLQLILAVVISIKYYNKMGLLNKKLFLCYWLAAAVALTAAVITWQQNSSNDAVVILFLFVIPMTVACYFLYVTNKLNKHLCHENPETPNPGI
jgi:hypothetical protein